MTYCPTWLIMSDWSWVTFWDTQDPVENVRKQSWNSEQNNAEINFGPIQIFITQIEILRRLLFPNPPFLPKSLWSSTHLCAVLSPWTRAPTFGSIPTREGEGQEHPQQAGERHEAWIPLHKCAQFCLSWEFSVFECPAAHIHSNWFLCDPFKQEVGFVMFIGNDGGKKCDSPQTFTLSIFLSQ